MQTPTLEDALNAWTSRDAGVGEEGTSRSAVDAGPGGPSAGAGAAAPFPRHSPPSPGSLWIESRRPSPVCRRRASISTTVGISSAQL